MTEHQRKLYQRASELLTRDDGAPRSRGETLRLARKFYKVEDHRLRIAHRAGGSGLENCRMRSDVTDVLVRFLWEDTLALIPGGERLPISVVANGGYGRSVMNPHSDLDLLFLFPGNNAVVDDAAASSRPSGASRNRRIWLAPGLAWVAWPTGSDGGAIQRPQARNRMLASNSDRNSTRTWACETPVHPVAG